MYSFASVLPYRGQPRRVAFIHDANVFGGMEVLQMNMLQHIDLMRYQPFVVVPGYTDPHRSSPPEFIAMLEHAGVSVLRPTQPIEKPVLGAINDVLNIASLLHHNQIDIAHIQTRHPVAARRATIAARLGGVGALVRTEHLPPAHYLPATARLTTKPFDLLTDRIVTDSDGDRQEQIRLVGRSAKKVIRSYCGIDALRFDPDHDSAEAKRRLGLDPDLPVVGAIGRLHEQKGHTFLIEAAADVLRAFGPVQFVIVGDGPLRSALEAQVQQAGIGQYVHFAGFQSAYVPWMEAMDIGTMPSLWEGFSISMQEFMALAKPLVVTNHGSFREAITNEQHGLIVPAANSAALGQAITRLLNDQALARKLGRAALQRVRSEFSIQNHMNELMALYDQLLAKRRRAMEPRREYQ